MDESRETRIPQLDFTLRDEEGFAARLVEILHTVGFVYLRNHGIDSRLIQKAFEVSADFFRLSQEEKLRYRRPEGADVNSGYVPVGMEKLGVFIEEEKRKKEFREAYNFLPFDRKRLPESLPDFEGAITDLFTASAELTTRIFACLAKGLDLQDKTIFERSHSLIGSRECDTTLRLLSYPPVEVSRNTEGELLRCGTHSDYGTITLLYQDAVSGLEVENMQDEFVPATPIPDCVLVNVGDLLQRWTSDYLRSTRHRVTCNNKSANGKVRQSMAFFVHPNSDFLVECLDGTNRYPAITGGDYLREKFKMTY
ncbi:hypothetical protein RvY_05639 [Ramazzottius varieornatus]|uniref:Fe2OG dioxygenase domain-containing protein n=1 Tax=Ramazzottius varieornatus TaxID=947166 RepID=A0A1D1V5I1_RAMVA|nr:hypothetical protein RvY_05639 [Ramazzottius varieornatus]